MSRRHNLAAWSLAAVPVLVGLALWLGGRM